MGKLKNKFILFIVGVIFIVLLFQLYLTYAMNQRDTNSYAYLLEWEATLNDLNLIKDEKTKLSNGDILSTKEKSLIAIEWWDGSVTRIGENTVLKIRENFVAHDYSQIRIWAEILSWKAWSKVVSMMGEKSYFKMYFNNLEAGVRGTSFDIDLDKAFIYVKDHELNLKKADGKEYLIGEEKPFSLNTFSFIEMQEFIDSLRDEAWQNMNETLDAKRLKELQNKAMKKINETTIFSKIIEIFSKKEKIITRLQNWESYDDVKNLINKLSPEEKENLYKDIYSQYQSINFASYKDKDLFDMKMNYKDILISLSPNEEQKELFLQYSFFDLQDIVQSGDNSMLEKSFEFFKWHKDIVSQMDINMSDYIDIENIPQSMTAIFSQNKEFLQEFFWKGVDWENFKLKTSIEDINNKAQEWLEKGINSIYNIFNKE